MKKKKENDKQYWTHLNNAGGHFGPTKHVFGFSFSLYFFLDLGRKHFGGTGEKTPKPHQFSILPFSLTKWV